MNTEFGLLVIALALHVWARMRQRREEAQKRVDAMLNCHVPKDPERPLYGIPTLPSYKIETPILPFDRSGVSDELPDFKFAPTDAEFAAWLRGRGTGKGA